MHSEEISELLEALSERHDAIQEDYAEPLPEKLKTSLCLLLTRAVRMFDVARGQLEKGRIKQWQEWNDGKKKKAR